MSANIACDWQILRFDEVAQIQFSNVDKNIIDAEKKVHLCNYVDVFKNEYINSNLMFSVGSATQHELDKFTINTGDVVFTKDSENPLEIAVPALVTETLPSLICGYHLGIARPKKFILGHYLMLVMQTDFCRRQLKKMANGVSRFGLGLNEIKSLKIPVPSMPEQQKIVEILSDCDTAIETSSEKIKCLKSELRGFREQLIANKSVELSPVKFSDVFERITSLNEGLSNNVLTISSQHGLVSQTDYFNKSVAGTDLSGYYYLQSGDFAYNRSYSDGYPMGAIKTLSKYANGVVSTLYMCFRLKAGHGQHDFLRHYFETSLFNRELVKIVQEGGRAHGLLNLKLTDLYATKIFLPSLDKQSDATVILGEIECELNLATHQLNLLKQQKRGLMQQLLTGKIRVKGTA